jgi:membrane protein implicated in regulation of membrane protease activity
MEWFRSIMLPPQGSAFAGEVDTLYMFLFWLSGVLFLGIAGAAIYFAWRYRYKPGRVTPHITHNTTLGFERLDEVRGCAGRIDGDSDHREEVDMDLRISGRLAYRERNSRAD